MGDLSSKTTELPSRRYGRYHLRSKLGSGGMADVFLADAVDRNGEQLSVALKLMRAGVSAEAFADEADLMGLLEHPNLVRRLEVGEAYGRPFIAMEFLIGGDLGHLIESHRQLGQEFPRAMGVHVCIEVLRALAYFHQARTRSGRPLGLVHGDVNPANVFFSGAGEVKLGDFGVAKALGANVGPGEGVTAGKLHYLSPEQTRGEPAGAPSDLFSAGIVLHELLLGVQPFLPKSDEPRAVMAAIRAGKLHLPDSLDRRLAQILKRALAPDLRDRYRTAGEFAGALFTWLLDSGEAPTSRDVQLWLETVLGLVV